jgi:serine/threonine protein kinase
MSNDASPPNPRPPSSRPPKSSPNALPLGTCLDEFELLKLLGVGGFGIVYLAFDHALAREVAVKEYMPAHMAGRGQTLEVLLHSNVDAQTFAMGLRSFLNEARFLARFDHPSLLKVLRFWQANGTAYMAMPVLRGRTLSEERQAMPAAPTEAWLRALLEPVLSALEKLHAEGVYHRDIAPDNIQIEPGGRPVLLDFGAARRVISDHSQALTAILKPGYSPIEQYAEAGAVKQGPWTDFYALGATLHYLLLGRPPAPATTRTVHNEASALTSQACPQCSAPFLQLVDWMLAPRPHDRPQSVAALRVVLDGRAQVPPQRQGEPAPPAQPVGDSDDTVVFGPPPLTSFPRTVLARSPSTAPVSLPSSPVAAGLPAGRPGSRSLVLLGSAAVALAALGVLAVMLWHMSGSSPLSVASPRLATPASAPAIVVAAPAASAAAAALASADAASAAVVVAAAQASAPLWPEAGPAPQGAAEAVVAVAVAAPASAVRAVAVKRVLAAAAAASRPAAQAPNALAAKLSALPTAAGGRPSGEEPATPPAVLVTAMPAPPEAAAPPPIAPEGSCSGLPYFRHQRCIERECQRAESQAHPDCRKWRRGANEGVNK